MKGRGRSLWEEHDPPAVIESVFESSLREINALEQRIVVAEDDADSMLWEQSGQVVAQIAAGLSLGDLAAQWINVRTNEPYSKAHVSYTAKTYRVKFTEQPRWRFRDAYNEIANGARRDERVETLERAARGNSPLAAVIRYPVVYADPPWRYEHVKTESRAIENQYPTMALEDICALPLVDVTTDDALLFLWATSPKLAEALQVVEAWGFTYRTSMAWVKDQIGMGYYARQRHELLLIATKGEPPVPAPGDRPDSVVTAPRGAHSAKPEIMYALIERMYPTLPRIELFARQVRDGWDQWGNQAP